MLGKTLLSLYNDINHLLILIYWALKQRGMIIFQWSWPNCSVMWKPQIAPKSGSTKDEQCKLCPSWKQLAVKQRQRGKRKAVWNYKFYWRLYEIKKCHSQCLREDPSLKTMVACGSLHQVYRNTDTEVDAVNVLGTNSASTGRFMGCRRGWEQPHKAQHGQRQGPAHRTWSAPGWGHLCWEGLGSKGRLREQDLLGRRRLWRESLNS